ncbi:MAG TPA: hydroxymethylbilane synthase [Acidimicrobiia bacterium]|nr:hydroxymethylbilane synthase [Acidimicrobiia bacterium]
MTRRLRIATRGSELARTQADRVAALLGGDCDLVIVSTVGDRRTDAPIWEMGGQGVFVKEVQEAVLDGRADLAVHSAKDLPSTTPEGLVIGAFPERADPRDCLVGSTLADLPTGAVVATGSVRRRAQLAGLRPDLSFAPLRGNIQTRLDKAAGFDAAVFAVAALDRLGLSDRASEILEPEVMLPQVGQGALAVECRVEDAETFERLAAVDSVDVRMAVTAERAFLDEMGSGCNLPVGAFGRLDGEEVVVEALLASLDGRIVLRHSVRGTDPQAAGRAVAAGLMDDRGGRVLLEESA